MQSETEEQPTPQQPIWEFAQELLQDAPPKELAKLPVDSATNHDHYHYLYGTTKQQC